MIFVAAFKNDRDKYLTELYTNDNDDCQKCYNADFRIQ